MVGIVILLHKLITLYIWAVIVHVVFSWLSAFGIVNMNNRFIYAIAAFLHRICEPVCRPIRNVLPDFGGIDISPIIVILGLNFLQYGLVRVLYGL